MLFLLGFNMQVLVFSLSLFSFSYFSIVRGYSLLITKNTF